MKRLSFILTLTVALIMGCLVSNVSIPSITMVKHEAQVTSSHHRQGEHRDKPRVSDARTLDHEASGAVITESQNMLRVCNNRPQRVPSLPGSKPTQASSHTSLPLLKNLHLFLDKRLRLEITPFSTSSACDYYVYALRHLLR